MGKLTSLLNVSPEAAWRLTTISIVFARTRHTKEMFLLERLARQPNEIVSLTELVKAMSRTDENVRGRGYLLVAERAGADLGPAQS